MQDMLLIKKRSEQMTEYEIHKLIEQQDPETKQRIWEKIQAKLKEQQTMKKWEEMTLDEKVEFCQNKYDCIDCEYIGECYQEFGGVYSPYFVQQVRKVDED